MTEKPVRLPRKREHGPNHRLSAVVKVCDGRGFVVQGECERFVVTAAHCLPHFPPCMTFSHIEERTYESLVGPLGNGATVWAECLFCDPISDVAVLGSPDNQDLFKQARDYEAMVGAVTPFRVSAGPAKGSAWLLSLDLRWFQCQAESFDGNMWWVSDGAEPIRGGMSGSPIVTMDGSAIGIVTVGTGLSGEETNEGGPDPRLVSKLPGWLLRQWKEKRATARTGASRKRKGT